MTSEDCFHIVHSMIHEKIWQKTNSDKQDESEQYLELKQDQTSKVYQAEAKESDDANLQLWLMK